MKAGLPGSRAEPVGRPPDGAPARALILSAGRGERLRPLTDVLPKTMLPVGGHPILEYQLLLLREQGIREFVVNLHHRPEVVSTFFGDGSRWDVRIHYSHEATLLGTAGAAGKAAALLRGGRFLVLYGDNLCDFDLEPLFRLHAERGAAATLGLVRGPEPTAGGIVALADDGRVTRFLEKPRPEEVFSDLVSAGIYLMEPEVLDAIPAERPSDFGRDVFPSLIDAGVAVYGIELRGTLLSVDTPELYRAAQQAVARGDLRHPLTAAPTRRR